MRRRILVAVVAAVLLVALLLGVPLAYTAWRFVEDTERNDLRDRLDRMSAEILAQEDESGLVVGGLDTSSLRLAIPEGGRLVVIYPTPEDQAARIDLGAAEVTSPIEESLSMGTLGAMRLSVPSEPTRTLQRQVLVVIALLIFASVAAGVVVAVLTVRRLSGPLRDVARRAARLAEGDFRPDARRHGIPELDRVSDVLDSATVEIAGRLQREHALVGDVSHQLRSRLTAVRLRLDELSTHTDPAVVEESEAALGQVDRLTDAIDDLVRQSRDDGDQSRTEVSVVGTLSGVVSDLRVGFRDARRSLVLHGDPALSARITESRLREAVAVLIDNSLVHGAGTCTVSVRRVRRAGGDPTVVVEVSDEGAGVSDHLVPHIFDRGVSGGGSTGVGLALARALVEADGGRLELQRRRPPLFSIFLGQSRRTAPSAPREPR